MLCYEQGASADASETQLVNIPRDIFAGQSEFVLGEREVVLMGMK